MILIFTSLHSTEKNDNLQQRFCVLSSYEKQELFHPHESYFFIVIFALDRLSSELARLCMKLDRLSFEFDRFIKKLDRLTFYSGQRKTSNG